jgi:hypothetical protein
MIITKLETNSSDVIKKLRTVELKIREAMYKNNMCNYCVIILYNIIAFNFRFTS